MYYTVSKNKIIYIPAAIFIFFAISPFFVALASNLATNSGGGGGSIPFEIPPDVRSNIEKNRPLYESVAKEYGIPWQALAAVHYREADCDPNKSSMSGEELGSENLDDHQVYTTLEESLKASAAHLKEMAKSVYQVELNENPDDASLGWAFLAYNRGYLYKLGKGCANSSCSQLKDCPGQEGTPYDKSPYVVNFIDENHKNMPWNGCLDSGWTFKDPRAGALTIYKLLGGPSSGGDACSSTTTGSSAKWVQKNGWEDWIDDPKVEIREYNEQTTCCRPYNQQREIQPNMVVLHWTGSESDTLDRIWNYFNNSGYDGAFVSFIIDKDGKIVQAAPANVREAGVRGYNGIPVPYNVNGVTVRHYGAAISIEAVGNWGQSGMPPQPQMESYVWLVQVLLKKYNLKPCDVWGHGELNPDDRDDPGKKFMEEMWKRLGATNITWQNHPGCINRPPCYANRINGVEYCPYTPPKGCPCNGTCPSKENCSSVPDIF